MPDYHAVPELTIKNYLTRLYIDLIGRDPTNQELQRDMLTLRNGNLDIQTRDSLILFLQTDTAFIHGDTSYLKAWHREVYESAKDRTLEGVPDYHLDYQIERFREKAYLDSVKGDWGGHYYALAEEKKLLNVRNSRLAFQNGEIDLNTMYGYMLYCFVYDRINMGTFNFINAVFEDLFFRFPTQAEYDASFPVIEYGWSGRVFGASCQTKVEYIHVLTYSREYHESMIRATYRTLLSRTPTAAEITLIIDEFYLDHDYKKVQRMIMRTDEYAQF